MILIVLISVMFIIIMFFLLMLILLVLYNLFQYYFKYESLIKKFTKKKIGEGK